MIQQWDFPVDEPVSLPEFRRHRLDDAIMRIAERIRAGTSIRSLAAEYGVSHEAIRRALMRAHITIELGKDVRPSKELRRTRAHRLGGRGRSYTLRPDEVAHLLLRHRAGESIRALARQSGVSHETMRRALANRADATPRVSA